MSDYDIEAQIALAATNPESFARVGLDFLSFRLNGDVLPDVNNPLVDLLTITSTQAAEHIQQALALDRRHYPVLAATFADLYGHMSDADYLDRFADPGMVTVQYIVELDSITNAMVEVTSAGLKKVVIPRYTEIIPGGEYTLTLLYPIEIRQLPHDGLQVVYNTDLSSPIQALSDNLLTYRYITDQNLTKYLQIDIPLYQLARTKNIEEIITAKSRFAFPFTDSYFYCRVFQGTSGAWVEMETTHSQQVYSATTPTAVLQVGDGVLNVTIPPIYFTNSSVSGNLRVDIYTTRGNVVKDLTNFDPATYRLTWGTDDDDVALQNYSASVPNLPYAVSSVDILEGGTNGLDFATQRERVIDNATPSQLKQPITPAQVKAKLSRLGFDIVLAQDDLTVRMYLATASLPASIDSRFTSGVGVAVASIQTTMASMVQVKGVNDNGDRITVTPDVLFNYASGVLSLVDDNARPDVTNLTPDTLVNALNLGSYAYTPFHYVLDTTANDFAFRAYYLTSPVQTSRRFVQDNATLLIEVNTSGFDIQKTATGYRLTVTITGGSSYTDLTDDQRYLQLAFTPPGETDYAYLNGTFMGITGTTAVWTFDILSDFDLDTDDQLIVKNFAMYDNGPTNFALPLDTEFLLLNIVANYTQGGYVQTSMDALLGMSLLPSDAKGLSQEFVTIKLGTPLTNLWRGARTLAGSYVYQTWANDVFDYYTADEYVLDANGVPEYVTNPDGSITLTILHAKGSPKLNADGSQKILHEKGSPVLDTNGQPVAVSPRPVTRILDFFVMDGNYFYANNEQDVADATYVATNIADTMLPKIQSLPVLEKTDIYLYPKKSVGSIAVVIDDGVDKNINSALSFGLKFFLSGTAFRDESYRQALMTSSSATLNAGVKLAVVSVSKLTDMLYDAINNDDNVTGFELTMFSDGAAISTFTVSDSSVQASVGRLIQYGDDGKFKIIENIDYVWKNTDSKKTA